jgi:hypothetical protein
VREIRGGVVEADRDDPLTTPYVNHPSGAPSLSLSFFLFAVRITLSSSPNGKTAMARAETAGTPMAWQSLRACVAAI